MKKSILSFLALTMFILPVSCSSRSNNSQQESKRLSFSKSEYEIHSGERINVVEQYSGITYSFAGSVPNNVKVDANTGVITFNDTVPNYTQVLLIANYQTYQSDPAIVTLLQDKVTTTLYFHTPIRNIIDGDYILASSVNNTAITFSLKETVRGVSIDSMSGRVSYNSAAVEGNKFTVVATSADQRIEEEYFVTKENLAISTTKKQAIEINSDVPATYVLDFSNTPVGTNKEVLAVMNGSKPANDDEYEFNPDNSVLLIKPSFLKTFSTGSNKLKIITPRNIITVELIMVTKFIKNAIDLQSINSTREALSGYYILENDIDLTDYLSLGGQGYNDNRGWNQIGIYHDLEPEPDRDSFKGTFDGNGHIISGFFEDRADDLAHNEGLFGYVNNQATIMNVGFVGAKKVTKGRNYIGGFVGFNEGIIRNCWVDVNISNTHEDKIFHSIGAFAGASTGVIENCYSLGLATGDTFVGAFVGKSFGEIKNCYALNPNNSDFYGDKNGGTVENCKVFASAEEMKKADYSSFDTNIWTIEDDQYPTLKNNYNLNFINGIEIANKENRVYRSEGLTIETIIHPNSLQDEYINSVQYSINDIESTGIIQNGNNFDVSNALVDDFVVTASIKTSYGTLATSKSFVIDVEPETIEFVDDLPKYVEPGKQYRINVNISPVDANKDLKWEILKESGANANNFAFFKDNILTIKEEIMNYRSKVSEPTFVIRCTTINGLSIEKTLTLKRIKYLSDKYCNTIESDGITQGVLNFYKDSNESHAVFTLPEIADIGNMKVFMFSKQISFSRSGHDVKIPLSYIKDIPNRQVTFTFRCGSGDGQTIYRGYACYIDHDCYTINDVAGSYIPLYSDEDFYAYFRMTLNDEHLEKYDNYDKTFVLMNDIDFNGATDLVAIGYKSSESPEAKPFSGKFYGFGHTIKNGTFHYSERYLFKGPNTDPAKQNRDPNTNRVGFFGYFSGQIYNVKFENMTSLSYNYGGCFAGEVLSGGYLEDVVFIRCVTHSTYTETDFTIDDLVQGRIAARSAGTFIGVTFNGTAVGLIG